MPRYFFSGSAPQTAPGMADLAALVTEPTPVTLGAAVLAAGAAAVAVGPARRWVFPALAGSLWARQPRRLDLLAYDPAAPALGGRSR